MQITIYAIGSRGDVQPFVALGRGLVAAGHNVRVVAPEPFRSLISARGLEFVALAANPRHLLEQETGVAWLESGRNFFTFVRRLKRLIEPVLETFLLDAWRASEGSDAILYSPIGIAGQHIAERLAVPAFAVALQPFSRTREFPSLAVPFHPPLGGQYNLLTHYLGEQFFWQTFREPINRWRRETLHLPAIPLRGPYGRFYKQLSPLLYGFSTSVVRRPADWPAMHHITGYWFLDRGPDWQPPAELMDFLSSGPPPVYVGVGSMRPRDRDAFVTIVMDALRRAKRRGLILSGWADLGRGALTDDVFAVADVPHDWLFPQMAAIVHHGGAGTTAAALRAGRPNIVLPFFADQPFWAERVFRLGAGPAPIPCGRLSVDALTAAIEVAAADQTMAAAATLLGARIRAEDGVKKAVRLVGQYLSVPARA